MKLHSKELISTGLLTLLLLSLPGTLAAQTTVPAGTPIVITLNQSVSSKDAHSGETVSGVVANDVVVGGKTVIPHNSNATLMVSSARASGRLSTPAKLYLRLSSVQVNGKTYTVVSDSAGHTAGSHKKRNIIAIGGGSALGAVIGGLAGGGKGAAIGAGAGAAAGTAGAAMTGKKDITLGAETKLRFILRQDLVLK